MHKNSKLFRMKREIIKGNLKYVKANCDKVDNKHIIYAATYGQTDIIMYLHSVRMNMRPALREACIQGHCDIVQYLLDNGVSCAGLVNIPACTGNIDIFNILIDFGLDVNSRTNSPILQAAKMGNDDNINRLYIYGCDVAAKDRTACSLNWMDDINKKLQTITLLLDLGVPATGNSIGDTPLHIACKINNLQAIQLLLSRAHTQVPNHRGATPLDIAMADVAIMHEIRQCLE